MKSRFSDRLESRSAHADPELRSWCPLAIFLWQTDPSLRIEFMDVVDLLDFMVTVSETLIESAEI